MNNIQPTPKLTGFIALVLTVLVLGLVYFSTLTTKLYVHTEHTIQSTHGCIYNECRITIDGEPGHITLYHARRGMKVYRNCAYDLATSYMDCNTVLYETGNGMVYDKEELLKLTKEWQAAWFLERVYLTYKYKQDSLYTQLNTHSNGKQLKGILK